MRRGLRLWPVLALAGCTVGPHYRTPSLEPVTPAGFAEASAATAAAPPPGAWWRLYQSPALDALVQKALQRNTDLRVAAADLAQARAVLTQARAGLFPSTGLAGSGAYGRGSTIAGAATSAAASTASSGNASAAGGAGSSGGGTTGVETGQTGGQTGGQNGGQTGGQTGGTSGTGTGGATNTTLGATNLRAQATYALSFDVSYEVDLFGRIRRGIQAARANVEAQVAAQDLARTTVAAETTRAFVTACAYAQQADVARRTLAVAEASLAIVTTQRDLGSASDYDVANVATLVEQTRAPIPTFEGQRRAALYSLAVLTGEPPERVSPEAAACRAPPPLVSPIPVGDGAGLLARRPDVRQAERQVAAAVARVGVATADLYPTVSLGGQISTAAHGLSDLGSRAGTSYSLGPLVSWTFPNLIAAKGRVREAEAVASGQVARFDGVALNALQEIEQALAAYGAELDRHAALGAARDRAAEAYRLANVRADNGAISFLDLLTVQRTLVAAQADFAASDTALAGDQITVFKALGGGWETAPPVPLDAIPQKGRAAPRL